ncbi:hypothetical protein B7759_00002 [Burkholderia glumae]|nr:hypothetical protein B7759_00002 [Burkholderia glumae]
MAWRPVGRSKRGRSAYSAGSHRWLPVQQCAKRRLLVAHERGVSVPLRRSNLSHRRQAHLARRQSRPTRQDQGRRLGRRPHVRSRKAPDPSEGSLASPSLTFANDGAPDTGLYHSADGQFGVTCNGASVVRFTPTLAAFDQAVTGPTPPTGDRSTRFATTEWVVQRMATQEIGTILLEVRTSVRAGCLKLNGALLNRADYPELWAYAQASGAIVADADWGAKGFFGCFSHGDGATDVPHPGVPRGISALLDDGRGIDIGRGIGTFQIFLNASHAHGASAAAVGDHAHSAWTDAQGQHNHPLHDPGHAHGVRMGRVVSSRPPTARAGVRTTGTARTFTAPKAPVPESGSTPQAITATTSASAAPAATRTQSRSARTAATKRGRATSRCSPDPRLLIHGPRTMLIHHYKPDDRRISEQQPARRGIRATTAAGSSPRSPRSTAPPPRTPTTWPFYRDGAWFLLPDFRGRVWLPHPTPASPVEIAVAGKTPDDLGADDRAANRHRAMRGIDGAWTVPPELIAREKRDARWSSSNG